MQAVNNASGIYISNNIMLTTILACLNILLVFIIIKLVKQLFNIKVSNKRETILFIMVSILSSIFGIFIFTPYSKIINMALYLILFYICLNTNVEKIILSINYISIVYLMGESIFSKIFGLIFSPKNISFIVYRIFCILFLFSILSVILYILKKTDFKLELESYIPKSSKSSDKILRLLEVLFSTNIMVLNLKDVLSFIFNKLDLVLLFSNAIILGIAIFRIILDNKKKQEQNLKTENLKIHNNNLLNMYDDMRSFKHDFGNIIQALGGYIETENLEGLMEMYSRLQKELCMVNDMETLNPALINNAAVYNILNNKYYIARKFNICMKIEVNLDINELKIDKLDLCRILGILLDNAIEAAKECSKKEILVRFVRDCKIDRNLIIIENSYKNIDVDLDKIFSKEYTSKKEKKSHGLGLWRVKKILDRTENLNLYSSKGLKFRQQLEIYDLKNAMLVR